MIGQWIKDHRKFIVAALVAGAIAVQSAITDDVVTKTEWVAIAMAALGALGVTAVRNGDKPPAESTQP